MAGPGAAGATLALLGAGFRDPIDGEASHSRGCVHAALLDASTVDHVLDSWDGDGGLRNVGGHHHQAMSRRRRREDTRLRL
jgi:hypothetical protein